MERKDLPSADQALLCTKAETCGVYLPLVKMAQQREEVSMCVIFPCSTTFRSGPQLYQLCIANGCLAKWNVQGEKKWYKFCVEMPRRHKAGSVDLCKQPDSVVLSNGKTSKTVARNDTCLCGKKKKKAICRMQESTLCMKRLVQNGVMVRKSVSNNCPTKGDVRTYARCSQMSPNVTATDAMPFTQQYTQ